MRKVFREFGERWGAAVVLSLILMLVFALTLTVVKHSRADAPPGLWLEQQVGVDGVTVHRIRDSQEKVVCWVASGWSDGPHPAITCLPERGR